MDIFRSVKGWLFPSDSMPSFIVRCSICGKSGEFYGLAGASVLFPKFAYGPLKQVRVCFTHSNAEMFLLKERLWKDEIAEVERLRAEGKT